MHLQWFSKNCAAAVGLAVAVVAAIWLLCHQWDNDDYFGEDMMPGELETCLDLYKTIRSSLVNDSPPTYCHIVN